MRLIQRWFAIAILIEIQRIWVNPKRNGKRTIRKWLQKTSQVTDRSERDPQRKGKRAKQQRAKAGAENSSSRETCCGTHKHVRKICAIVLRWQEICLSIDHEGRGKRRKKGNNEIEICSRKFAIKWEMALRKSKYIRKSCHTHESLELCTASDNY